MIQKLKLHHFRNLADADLPINPGITLISGSNGHGKTNVLEALHWVSQGWSFKSRTFEQTLQFGQSESWLQIEGLRLETQESWRQDLQYKQGQLHVRTPEKEGASSALLHGHFLGKYMGPEDISLVREGPELRRRWLDILLCQRHHQGVEILSKYKRILQQRNRWLKDHKGQVFSQLDNTQKVLWETFSEHLSQLGSQIISMRLQLLREIAQPLYNYYQELSTGAESIDIQYASFYKNTALNLDHCKPQELQILLRQKLESIRNLELHQGVTGAGPHKDDVLFRFVANQQLLREIGSQGQCRTVALAMGLVSLDIAQFRNHQTPLLLLDDIFAELDASRREALAQLIRGKSCQALIASPRAADLPFAVECQWTIIQGAIKVI